MINVLIVDDNKFVVHSMQRILEELEFNIVGMAHDGLQAIEKFTECSPDVTILDITMPNMDGIECLSRIREIDPDARVVMLSAIQDQQTVNRCIEHGASGFLQKPIRKGVAEDMDRLCHILEHAVGKTV